MEKVRVKSLVSHKVVIDDESKRVKRTWDKKNAIRMIPLEDLEELIYDPGVEYMFKEGMLDIDGDNKDEILVKLGLKEEGEKSPIIILTDEDRRKLMNEMTSLSAFREKINELPREQLNELVEYCVDNKIMNYEKTAIIKDKTGRDIISMIRLQEADKEDTSKEE